MVRSIQNTSLPKQNITLTNKKQSSPFVQLATPDAINKDILGSNTPTQDRLEESNEGARPSELIGKTK